MDRNSIIGLIAIGAILIGFTIYNQPSDEEIAELKRQQDSIAAIQQANTAKATATKPVVTDTSSTTAIVINDTLPASDSLKQAGLVAKYGDFAGAAFKEEKTITIENEFVKYTLSNKGGRVISAILKQYKTHDSLPVNLVDKDSTRFGLSLISKNITVNTDSLQFESLGKSFIVSNNDSNKVIMRLKAGETNYIDYIYELKGNSYLLNFSVNFVNMNQSLASNVNSLPLFWESKTVRHEKGKDNEANATTIYYKYMDDEVDYLSEMADDQESLPNKVQWISFKQQFFTNVLLAKEGFDKPIDIETKKIDYTSSFGKELKATLAIPFNHSTNETKNYTFYFGPNHYKTLKDIGYSFEKQVPLGWGIFGWVNRFGVIPVFNFLSSFNINFGIIILILTILIKAVLFPLTYKAYLSQAKMKILKPELDEINKENEGGDPMKKQQAVMALYKKAGVSPMGGCLPMLLQMPILIAMFRFFPASIELRQQSFLWATDLSTYDTIYDFGFSIPWYGDHVSLFTLLMTVSTILYTRMNDQFSGAGNPQMAQMKWIMYLMPIIFLGVFNNYAAGLSYYYFLANMMTFAIQFLMKRFVDEKALHAKIEENKKKPVTKSKFQSRLEEIAKQKGAMPAKKK
ncbi:MAG: membrane protein insertase YidC [Bacteroidota bacterium]